MEENQQSYRTILKKINIFPDDSIKICKDNDNKARFVPIEVKYNIDIMVK